MTTTETGPDPLARLLSDLIDGDLVPADGIRLADLIATDAQARERYLACCELHALLQWEHGVLGTMTGRPTAPPRTRRWWRRGWFLAVAAATLALGVSVAAWWSDGRTAAVPPTPTALPAALLEGLQDCRWTDAALAPTPGSLLAQGRCLDLAGGTLALTFTSGATMVVAGPARLELVSPWHAILHRGAIRTRVPAQAVGFRVTAPQVEVVDLGTSFGLIAGDGHADLFVLGGSVQATVRKPDGNPGETVVMRKGEEQGFSATGLAMVADPVGGRARIEGLAAPAAVRTSGRILRWSFDATSGAIAMASDGNGLPRPDYAAHWVMDPRQPIAAIPGRFGNALHFTGGTHAKIGFPDLANRGARSLACWIRLPADGTLTDGSTFLAWDRRTHVQGVPNAAWVGWNLDPAHGPLGALRTMMGRTLLVGSIPLRDDRWHHLAVVMAPGEQPGALLVSQYVDGRLDGRMCSAAPTRPLPTVDAGGRPYKDMLFLGRDPRQVRPEHFQGDLDELVIIDRVLTQPEVIRLMETNRCPDDGPPPP